ncbi:MULTISPECIES: hypothetical protein [Paracoccaceae]|jgi:hypothetical protein|uniref:hypothetical protein n=1 Tax=Paracoccaceae TaxID=31989 RepID=UPI0015737C0A|nr:MULTISPECIES: hypothetical protein [Paracoccaceae]MBJ2153898.1 hypothetical protein [Paracoccus sp. IB05]NTT88480.1 hypothetical protein [Tabrizicola sp. SY72]
MRQLVAIIALISFAFVSLATMSHGTRMAMEDTSRATSHSVMVSDDEHGGGHGNARPMKDNHCTENSACTDEAGLCAAYCAKLTTFTFAEKYGLRASEAFVSRWRNNDSSRLTGRVPALQDRPPKPLLI